MMIPPRVALYCVLCYHLVMVISRFAMRSIRVAESASRGTIDFDRYRNRADIFSCGFPLGRVLIKLRRCPLRQMPTALVLLQQISRWTNEPTSQTDQLLTHSRNLEGLPLLLRVIFDGSSRRIAA
jgi:hypothetical protein